MNKKEERRKKKEEEETQVGMTDNKGENKNPTNRERRIHRNKQ